MEFKNRITRDKALCGKNVLVDTIHFKGPVDVTDPGYDRDVWCRINDLQVEEGDYDCIAVLADEGLWGICVKRIGIYLDGKIPRRRAMKYVGNIGVDAGLAGFFMNKPDFTDEEWIRFCDEMISDGCAWTIDDGFFSESGYGDGSYDLYGHYNENGVLDALELVFI